MLQKETKRLGERIDRLLDWGRMEAGRRIYERKPEEVRDILAAALEVFDTATVGRGHEVDLDMPDDLPRVFADRGAMVDAISNLLSNAWKYTGDEKEIVLSAAADARSVRIAVRDNGRGIPKKEQNRIFEKFYRSDDRLSREVEGSGLGLAIVRHVARAHGGHVEVESEPGRGSTFTIILPRPKPEAQTSASGSTEPVAAG